MVFYNIDIYSIDLSFGIFLHFKCTMEYLLYIFLKQSFISLNYAKLIIILRKCSTQYAKNMGLTIQLFEGEGNIGFSNVIYLVRAY